MAHRLTHVPGTTRFSNSPESRGWRISEGGRAERGQSWRWTTNSANQTQLTDRKGAGGQFPNIGRSCRQSKVTHRSGKSDHNLGIAFLAVTCPRLAAVGQSKLDSTRIYLSICNPNISDILGCQTCHLWPEASPVYLGSPPNGETLLLSDDPSPCPSSIAVILSSQYPALDPLIALLDCP